MEQQPYSARLLCINSQSEQTMEFTTATFSLLVVVQTSHKAKHGENALTVNKYHKFITAFLFLMHFKWKLFHFFKNIFVFTLS